MAREVQPKRAEDFFALAEQLHESDPLAARAVEISGRIAGLRHFAYELASKQVVPVGEIEEATRDKRIELRKQTHTLSSMYAKQPGTENSLNPKS